MVATRVRLVHALLLGLCALCTGAPKGSVLAQKITYLSTHAFLHSFDNLPKVILLKPSTDADDAKEQEKAKEKTENTDDAAEAKKEETPAGPPGWFTSAAVKFKNGRTKTVAFAYAEGDEAKKIAARLGVSELPPKGSVFGCAVDGKNAGELFSFTGDLAGSSGAAVREVKAFAQELLDEQLSDGQPLPAFPPPDVPRKAVSLSLLELTHDNLPTHCFGGSKAICMIALLPPGANECPGAMTDLARRHKHDAIQFSWLKAGPQEEFISAFGVSVVDLPRLIAVRTGSRSRFAVLEGLNFAEMATFVDRILGGDMTFKRLKELPELVPPYLMDSEENREEEDKEEL